MNFLDSGVSLEALNVALKLNVVGSTPQNQGKWKLVSAGELGLGGDPSTVFFGSSYSSNIGMVVYRNANDPSEISIVFSPISFTDLPAVFPQIMPTPPQFNTDYADDFAAIYAAIEASFASLDTLFVSGFSLGGIATNQLSESYNAHFSGVDASFVSFGSEYIAANNKVLNFGATNDWLFQSYNLYAQLFQPGDPELVTYDDFADLFSMDDADVQALNNNSFLNGMFEAGVREFGTNGTWTWYFDFGVDDEATSFNLYNHFAAHGFSRQKEAVQRVLDSSFGNKIKLDSVVIFDFDDAGVVSSNTGNNAFLSDLPSKPGKVFVLGDDEAGDRINGRNGVDYVDGFGGNDVLKGKGGNDKLYGGKGKDKLFGDAGNDKLFGGKGNDKLFGGKGNDKLTGGKGKDVFVFKKNEGKDTITDFQNSKDKIDLKAFNFDNKAAALAKFYELGSASNDKLGFKYKGTEIIVKGIDMGDLNGADIVI